jgi:hypothetical protein
MTVRARKIKGLGRQAEALLSRLVESGAFAVAAGGRSDLALQVVRNGISLGAGKVPLAVAEELVAADCAAWQDAGNGRQRLVASASGRARAQRRREPNPDLAFLAQHTTIGAATVGVDGIERTVRIDEAESPLAWLYRRRDKSGKRFLDAASFAAGERLRLDLTLGLMLPRVTANWSTAVAQDGRSGGGGPAAATEAALAARQRATRALAAVGSEFSGLLLDVCGFLKSLAEIERERGWPARSGKLILRFALSRLAEHYGLRREVIGAPSRGIRAWSAPATETEHIGD